MNNVTRATVAAYRFIPLIIYRSARFVLFIYLFIFFPVRNTSNRSRPETHQNLIGITTFHRFAPRPRSRLVRRTVRPTTCAPDSLYRARPCDDHSTRLVSHVSYVIRIRASSRRSSGYSRIVFLYVKKARSAVAVDE